MCLEGASRAGVDLLAAIPDDLLRAQFIWVPMLPLDNESAATNVSQRFAGRRVTHYWDAERHLARHMGRALDIKPTESVPEGDIGLAWDIYMAHAHGPKDIERPDFWMHQLAVTHAPRLDHDEWRKRVQALL